MSAHFHHPPRSHNPLTTPLKSSILRSRIHRHPTTNSTHPALTPFELIILILALGSLIALVCWLAWIMIEYCITFVRGKLSDLDLGKRMRKNMHRAEQAPKSAFKLSERLAMLGIGALVSVGKAIFRRDDGARGDGEREEQRRLLGAEAGRREERSEESGYGFFGGRHGYYEGMLYASSFGIGQDGRPRYADGMSESSGCVGQLHGHREECVGECTLQTRRRSGDS